MTSKAITTRPAGKKARHSVLVVDCERGAGRMCTDMGATLSDCEVVSVRNLAEARKLLEKQSFSLLVADMKLPDGSGLSLLPELRKCSPHAGVVVTGKGAGLEDVIDAMRSGANDFVPKPFTSNELAGRISHALSRQDLLARNDRKIARLREAVKKLSEARKMVTRKVDLLCNDLVGAYGELSRQVDSVRTTEDFRRVCDVAKDLEQLLCHVMDWVMRRVGYANIAVFLAGGEAEGGAGATSAFQLGAYVKYTMPSSPEMTDALKNGLVTRAGREGFVRMTADESARDLTAAELRHLRGQAVIAANCTYLGESLATLVLFRDGCTPFTNEDAETFRAIAPVFAIALAGQVRVSDEGGGGGEDSASDEPEERRDEPRKEDKTDADWWKRGEAPPF